MGRPGAGGEDQRIRRTRALPGLVTLGLAETAGDLPLALVGARAAHIAPNNGLGATARLKLWLGADHHI